MARRAMPIPTSWSWLAPLRSLDLLQGAHQGHAAAGNDAFLDRRAGGVQGVLDPGLLLLHLHLGGGTDLDDGHAAGQLGQALLELLLVVVGGGLLDLLRICSHPALDVGLGAGTVDDGGLFLGDLDLLGGAQLVEGGLLQGQAHFLGDDGGAGEDGDVLQHGLAAVAEARGLDGADLDDAANGVDHQGGQGLTLDVLGDEQQGLAGLGHALEHRAAGRGCC